MNVGQFLKQRREEKGMTLEQVADITKISLRHVAALEENKFDLLPSKAYAKGFLKLYAKCVDASPDEVVLRYETLSLSPLAAAKTEPISEPAPQKKREPFNFRLSGRTVFVLIAIIVIILAAIFSSM